jgi:hypothetical protein
MSFDTDCIFHLRKVEHSMTRFILACRCWSLHNSSLLPVFFTGKTAQQDSRTYKLNGR